MIQDIFPYRLNNQYKNIKIDREDTVLYFSETKILAKFLNGKLIFPTAADFGLENKFTYLFTINADDGFKQKYFLLSADDFALAGGKLKEFELYEVRQIRDSNVDLMYKVFAMMTGKHLNDWYKDTKFCGRCGGKMTHSESERAMVCTECGYTAYPRIMPAVIVGIINGEKLLLTKYNRGYANNALVAGFTEIGETAEQTVEREVMEETGLKVKNIRYYKTQPWGLANDLLLGYYCDVDGDTTIRMDANELKEASWVERNDIVLQPTKISLTNEMMERFKNGEKC